MDRALNAIGQTYRGFRITQYSPLEELQSTLIELVHEPTGARVMQIANNDPENLFCLSFKTLPDSSNGVAHILEHTVLCGSRKFPIKDPFFSMTRRSLNTYMNALTGQDFTCYPASSQVEKDFYNLLEVYADAVFHPNLKKESFLQEGHRFAFTEPENSASPLTYQGVVYNEMKGAMNSPDSRLFKALGEKLTPDLTYAYNSGGDPKEIPALTHEELIDFHKTFYNPSRCLFFFYGNLPLSKHLDFILTHALEGAEKTSQIPLLPRQKRFTAPVYAEGHYPISAEESAEGKAMIAINWLTAPIAEQTDLLGLSLIDVILMDTDASYLKKALLKSGLCAQADSSIDLEMSEVPFTIICKGCKETDAENLKNCCFETLEKFISQPISPEKVEAALHQLEFDRMEIGAEGIPFGLTLFFRSALLKQHGVEPESGLLIHTLFNDLRARLKDPSFIPNLVRKYLLDNPHFILLTLKADPKLEQKENQEERDRLDAIQAKLSPQKAAEIVRESKHLAQFQEEQENLSLDCLPKVTLDDVPRKAVDFPLSEKKGERLSVYHTDAFTNQILYADLLFDLPHFSVDELPLLSLYTRIFTELGCGGRNYAKNLEFIEAYTGGADASLSLHPTFPNSDLLRPAFSIRIKALKRHTRQLFDLLKDFAQGVDLTDRERLREWMLQHATELQNRLSKNAMNYAVQLGFSGITLPSFVYNRWHGLPYYNAIQKWVKDDRWIEGLQKIQHKLFGGPAELVLSCDASQFQEISQQKFFGLAEKLPKAPFTPWKSDYSLEPVSSQGRLISSPVAFTVQTLRTCTFSEKDAAMLLIAGDLLDNVALHTEIREKGGAYGSGATYAPTIGNFHLYSYRDPNLSKTIQAFQNALDQIASSQFDEEDLEEAKLGVIQTLDAPVPPGNRAMTAYSWKRAGRTLKDRQAFREAILGATSEQVAQVVSRRLLKQPRTTISFLGQDLYDKEKDKVSLPLLSIQN
ncbi:MAG: insulinase family protein [Verrucomicrobia bacterium]|nr:insulinase family protein [Verrucomicrobiota bacterium]